MGKVLEEITEMVVEEMADVVEFPRNFVSTEAIHYDAGPCDGCVDHCDTCKYMEV